MHRRIQPLKPLCNFVFHLYFETTKMNFCIFFSVYTTKHSRSVGKYDFHRNASMTKNPMEMTFFLQQILFDISTNCIKKFPLT